MTILCPASFCLKYKAEAYPISSVVCLNEKLKWPTQGFKYQASKNSDFTRDYILIIALLTRLLNSLTTSFNLREMLHIDLNQFAPFWFRCLH